MYAFALLHFLDIERSYIGFYTAMTFNSYDICKSVTLNFVYFRYIAKFDFIQRSFFDFLNSFQTKPKKKKKDTYSLGIPSDFELFIIH